MAIRLAIVGGGMTMMQAPFDDPGCDIWTTGSISKLLPRATGILDIHKVNHQDFEILNRHECIVWMQEKNPLVLMSERFPIEDLEIIYGKMLDCSMTMLLALAYIKGYTDISLYGVDMALEHEYEKFRANLLYMIGLGRGEGRDIYISDGSLLMPDCLTYEYDYPSIADERLNAYRLELEEKLKARMTEKEQVEGKIQYLRGALDMMRELRKIHGGF